MTFYRLSRIPPIVGEVTGTEDTIIEVADDVSRDELVDLLEGVDDGGVPAMIYAHNASAPTKSLSHQTGIAVNDTFTVQFYGADRQPGSGATWQCYTLTGAGTLGDIAYVAGQGLVLEGTNARFKLIPGPGDVVDIRAANIVCDGETTGQQSKLTRCIQAATNQGWTIVNKSGGIPQTSASSRGQAFKTTETIDLRGCNCDLMIQAGDQGDVVGGTPFYTGVEPGMTTDAVDGVTKAIAVRAGGNLNNRHRLTQRLWVQGDGIFNNPATASCIGVRLENNDSGLTDEHITTAYCAVGVMILGPTEKHRCQTRHQFNNHAVYTPSDSSADTIYVEIDGQNCWHFYTEEAGVDTSVRVNANVENREDPGDGSPAFYFRGGKHAELGGRIRGHNGDVCVKVDKSTSYGVDTMFFNNWSMVHGYGVAVQVDRCRRLGGHIDIKDWDDAPDAGGATPTPGIWLNRVKSAGGFTFNLVGINSREGLRIGDAANNYFPQDTDFHGAIEMGDTGEGSFPTSLKAVVIEKMTGGSLNMRQCMGQVELLAAATGVDVILPKATKRYTLTRTAGETCVVNYGGIVATVVDADGRTLTANESGNEYSNAGASAEAVFTLPAAAVGLQYSFVCEDNSGLQVTAGAGDSINVAGTATADGGNIDTTTIGATITLKCFDAAVGWVATSVSDTTAWA